MKIRLLSGALLLAAGLFAEEITENVSIRKDANMPQQNLANPEPILTLGNHGTFGSNVIEFRGENGVKAAAIEQTDNAEWGQVLRFGVNMPGAFFEYPIQISFWGLGAKNIYPYGGNAPLFDESVYPNTIRPIYLAPFVGTNGSASGVKGAVPAPQPGDSSKCLKGNGAWGDCNSSLSSKGQIATYTDNGSASLNPGPNQAVLSVDSSTTTGLKWGKLRSYVETYMPTASSHGNTCAVGSGIYIKGAVPKCSVGPSTGTYAWAGLDFPDAATSCVTFQTLVPRKWDGSRVEARMMYTRVNGLPGQVRFVLKTSYNTDGVDLSALTFNPDTLPDVLPVTPINRKMTGTFRDVNMTGAQGGFMGIFQLCREGANALDTTTATIKVTEIYFNWPVSVGFAE